MPSYAIIGAQWGDEGKGKITDYLAEKADVVVRFQGGDNAGHTIYANGQKFALHLLPSGSIRPQTLNVLGNGMVINPHSLLTELKTLNDLGLTPNIAISNRAHVILPHHIDTDKENEKTQHIGTTLKGIGPAYMDKVGRTGLRMGAFVVPHLFEAYLRNDTVHGFSEATIEKLIQDYAPLQTQIAPYVQDTSYLLSEAFKNDKFVLFEGAQGTLLDIDHGTYPYVTSSATSAAGISQGAGVSPKQIQKVLGIVKAYTTRVGEGTLVSEMDATLAHEVREKGNEYGTTTGRPRRIGYLDLVALKHAHRVNQFDALIITLFDVLSGLNPLKLVVAYDYRGTRLETFPAEPEVLAECRPIFETLEGFKEDISQMNDYVQLPVAAKNYLKAIELHMGVPVGMISVGKHREQTLQMTKIL
jgi:adenylosuccinate synthase